MTMEEVGLLREARDPDTPGPLDESESETKADQPFRVLSEPYMPVRQSSTDGRLRLFNLQIGGRLTNLLLAIALVGVMLIPVLAVLTRFVNGQPIFGCEIKPLASKSCRPDYRRMSPA